MKVKAEKTFLIDTSAIMDILSYEELLALREEAIAEIQKREEEPRT